MSAPSSQQLPASPGVALALSIISGNDRGARLELGDVPRVIGRARDADLVLSDPAVSRRHVEVKVGGQRPGSGAGSVTVRSFEGARPFLVRGEPVHDATLVLGDSFIVGATTLQVVDGLVSVSFKAAPSSPAGSEVTDVRALLAGASGPLHGLHDLHALVEALDAASGEGARAEVFTAWARTTVGATAARVLDQDEVAADPALAPLARGELVLLPQPPAAGGGTDVIVPASSGGVGAVVVRVPLSVPDVGATLRRILIVAARLFASNLSQARNVERAEEQEQNLRSQAIGSARGFLGGSDAAASVARLLPRLSASDATVLLLGESGVGKSFYARLLHEAGPRAKEPLRILNCAAIPESLVESELFGHERGAFTGADATRIGAFEAAARGTVLLDEIGELPLASQAKLLRVLEERVFERVGSQRSIPLRARILAATNVDLEAAISAGTFRRDLFYRISVVNLRIPSLRERAPDIPLLAERVLKDLAATAGRRLDGFDDETLRLLRGYAWPGNVRELRNVIEHAVVLGDGSRIKVSDLPESLRVSTRTAEQISDPADPSLVRLPANLDWLEARAIEEALKACGGNRTKAASILGINRVTLYKKLKVD